MTKLVSSDANPLLDFLIKTLKLADDRELCRRSRQAIAFPAEVQASWQQVFQAIHLRCVVHAMGSVLAIAKKPDAISAMGAVCRVPGAMALEE